MRTKLPFSFWKQNRRGISQAAIMRDRQSLPFTASYQKSRNSQYQTWLVGLGFSSFTLGFMLLNTFLDAPKEIESDATLSNHPDKKGVVSLKDLEVISLGTNQGRSQGSKYCIKQADGREEFYYHKHCSCKQFLLDEAFVGSLMHLIEGNSYPKILIAENPITESTSGYSVLSQSITYSSQLNENLESWALSFLKAESAQGTDSGLVGVVGNPEGVGVALALDMVMG